MAERMHDGGGTKVEPTEPARPDGRPVDADRPEPTAQRPTSRTLDEQAGRLSEAEERFERARRTVGLFLGPLVFLALLALPLDLDGRQQALAAVLGLVVTWWISEAIPIPITGLLGLCLCVILNVASADDVFGSVADSTIFLFIGSFIIAEAMLVHGLDRRSSSGS
jgi:solute carrier family 13 (sodium-dependent dicarboxylate transporter), member 2/3/5